MRRGAIQAVLAASLAVLAAAPPAVSAEFFVAPDGKPAGDGSVARPWDLATALKHPPRVKPGDTIWVREGKYRAPGGKFSVRLRGESDKRPIIVRAWKHGRATLHSPVEIAPPSRYTWLWGLEITRVDPPEWFFGLKTEYGVGNKYINLVVHGCGAFAGVYDKNVAGKKGAVAYELYGCLIYDTRAQTLCKFSTPRHEYTRILDNMLFDSGTTRNVKLYSVAKTPGPNFEIEGNFVWCRGYREFTLVGRKVVLRDNVFHNTDFKVASGEEWTVKGNLFVRSRFVRGQPPGNLYWKRGDPVPAAPRVVLRPNRYDPDRAHLAIINWQKADRVVVLMAPFLKPGESFRLMAPRRFYGKPVYRGRVKADGTATVPTKGEFNVFVILRGLGKPQGTDAAAVPSALKPSE